MASQTPIRVILSVSIILLLTGLLAACQTAAPPAPTATPTLPPTHAPATTATPPAPTSTPIETEETSLLQKIARIPNPMNALCQIGWGSDDDTVWVRVDDLYLVNLTSGAYQLETSIVTPTPPVDPGIEQQIQELPPFTRYAVCPAGDCLLYGLRVFTRPTPTPDPRGLTLEGREYVTDVYLVTKDSPPINLGRIPAILQDIIWLPNGKKAVINPVFELPGEKKLWIVDRTTHSISPFAAEQGIYFNTSLDSLWVLYQITDGVYIYQVELQETIKIPAQFPYIYNIATWSPDGGKIYFANCTDRNRAKCFLVSYDVKQGVLEVLIDLPLDTQPGCMTISPQSDRLVYMDDKTGDLYMFELAAP